MLYTPRLLAGLAAALRRNLSQWGFSPASAVKLLHYSENACFIVRPAAAAGKTKPSGQNQTGEAWCFRFYRPFYHENAEIAAELRWLAGLNADETLRAKGLRFPVLRKTKSGAAFISFAAAHFNPRTAARQNLPWRLCCFAFLPGRALRHNAASKPLFAKLGEMAALLHAQSRAFCRAQGAEPVIRPQWNYETMAGEKALWGDWRKIPMAAADYALLARLSDNLQGQSSALAQKRETLLIHADMRAANLLAGAGAAQISPSSQTAQASPAAGASQAFPALLDFDDCGFAPAAQDCANALSFIETAPNRAALIKAWLSGYRLYADTALIEAALPVCLMLRRLQLTAWLSTHAETPAAKACGRDFLRGTLRLAADFV